ncbi:RluA family pseudouridine synthase [Feifania hominis]|uniref:Pseudouridine synthase n=1 Tax=Feifania hominis TaxID=2763660 RepID=A0A926HUF7_9FIRM|nr:RluA family pseudouridine synthase [Feifania hominis]MBC8535506.1 RluA family pseudouridine synthase [Feifania hominis]
MRSFTIAPNDAGQRLDKFLHKAVKKLPASLLYKSIRTKRIKVNGARAALDYRLREGDLVELYLKDAFFDDTTEQDAFCRVRPNFKIVYEDENILLVDKQPGLISQSDAREQFNTLAQQVKAYLYQKGEFDPVKENSFSPALCNRLDRNTGGIVIAAKNAETLRIMNEKIKRRELHKYYLCAVVGRPEPAQATLTDYLVKNEAQNRVYIHHEPVPGGKKIITRYRVLRSTGDASLCEVELITGRTHQIRAHMASIGHPLIGDGKYGKNEINRRFGQKTQLLYAYKLTFDFEDDAGILSYLDKKTFQIEKIAIFDKIS